jgi:hypothetical protein
MFSLVAGFAATAIGLAVGIIITVWPPQTRRAKRAWGGVASLLFTVGVASLLIAAPVKWRWPIAVVQYPIVWLSSGNTPLGAKTAASPIPSPKFGRIPNQADGQALRQCKKELKTAQGQLSDSKTELAKTRQQLNAKYQADATAVQKIIDKDKGPLMALIIDSAAVGIAMAKYQQAVNKLMEFKGTHLTTPWFAADVLQAQNNAWQASEDKDVAVRKLQEDATQLGKALNALDTQ